MKSTLCTMVTKKQEESLAGIMFESLISQPTTWSTNEFITEGYAEA